MLKHKGLVSNASVILVEILSALSTFVSYRLCLVLTVIVVMNNGLSVGHEYKQDKHNIISLLVTGHIDHLSHYRYRYQPDNKQGTQTAARGTL